jgi:hypothetical protein
MEKPYAPPYPFIEVVWDDAASNSETWVEPAAITGLERVITRGWLIKETEAFVALASSVPNEEIENVTVGNTMTIPIGMIVSRRVLKLTTAKPRAGKPKP